MQWTCTKYDEQDVALERGLCSHLWIRQSENVNCKWRKTLLVLCATATVFIIIGPETSPYSHDPTPSVQCHLCDACKNVVGIPGCRCSTSPKQRDIAERFSVSLRAVGNVPLPEECWWNKEALNYRGGRRKAKRCLLASL